MNREEKTWRKAIDGLRGNKDWLTIVEIQLRPALASAQAEALQPITTLEDVYGVERAKGAFLFLSNFLETFDIVTTNLELDNDD